MRGIGHDGQVRELVNHRNRGDIHGVARGGLIGADAALAEDHVVVAAGHDVLAGEQQFLDGGGDAALEQHRLAYLAQFAQQIEVLHIARPHLEAIRVRQHRLNLRNLHHLADREQTIFLGRFVHQLQTWNAEALEGVRRAARLEGASAQKARARGFHAGGNGEDLRAVFNGARAGDDRDLVAANFGAVGKLHHSAFRAKCAAGEFVGRGDAMNIEHAREQFKLPQFHVGGGSHASQNGLCRARGAMNIDSNLHHGVDDCIDLLFGGPFLHGYNHCLFPVSGVSAPVPWPG